MNPDTFYLVCFSVGLALSLLSFIGGFAHLHIGRFHIGHTHHMARGHGISSINGFTVPAFLCWFGGAGYLLHRFSTFAAAFTLLLALLSGLAGAGLLWAALFKILLPRERVLTAEDTEMTGVLAEVSNSIRDSGGIGEILFTQTGARRCAAARSEDGIAIPRGTEVVVLRYERGVAWVRPMSDLAATLEDSAARPRL